MPTRQAAKPGRIIPLPDISRMLTPDRIRRYPLLLLAVTVTMYLVGVARSDRWIEPNGRIIGRDYLAFYMAGDMAGRGHIDRLYDPSAQTAYQKRFMRDINPQWTGTCLYLNPPHYAWALSFPAALGYGPSLILWWVASIGCFVATVWLWRRWGSPVRAGAAILLAVCMPAWFWALAGGQNSFFSLLILTVFCTLLIAGRDAWAGLALSLLAFKFQLLLVPAGLLLFKRRWRALSGLGVGGVLTLALTVAVFGWHSIADYVALATQLGRLMQVEGFDVWKQHSWHGFFALLGQGWMPAGSVRMLVAAASVLSLVLLGRVWRGAWSSDSPRFALQLSALMMATLLTSPHLFHYDMLIATLPAMLWLRASGDRDVTVASAGFKVLVAAGFVWLAMSGVVADAVHVQLSPFLMLAWLVFVRRVIRTTP
ncbi:MAG: DUF2029 domain-containing protein [Phycisphaerales bacterium]|nr:MAG: DUF2029 domain-containing protein [Phycisphaerales bacterium]